MRETSLTKKKKPVFAIVMVILVILSAVAIVLTLRWLWDSLERYESGTPDTAMRDYLARLGSGDFDLILEDADFTADALNTGEDYKACLARNYDGIDPASPQIDFRLTTAKGEEGWQQYLIFEAEQELGELWISPAPEESGRKWLVRGAVGYLPGYTVTAPQHLEVSVSGRKLDHSNAKIEEIAVPVFDFLPDEKARPKLVRYTTGQTLYSQEVAVTGPGGAPCVLQKEEGQGDERRLEAWESLPTEREEEYRGLIEQAAKIYAAFITADAKFDELKPYLLPDTEFYEGVRTFYSGWYIDHDSFGYENISIEEITAWSEDTFSGHISFDYIIHQGWRVHTFPSSYHMSFIRSEGEWKLVHIQVQ